MKLYIIVRSDLSAGAQAAQACHGLRAFAAEHPELDAKWYAGSNNLVLLALPNEGALLNLIQRAHGRDVACSCFREPDFDDSVTAVALLGPEAHALTSSLPLALRARAGALEETPASV